MTDAHGDRPRRFVPGVTDKFIAGWYYSVDYERDLLLSRVTPARDALQVLLRASGLSRFRLLDVACQDQHRVAQVLKAPGGPIYVAKHRVYDTPILKEPDGVERLGPRTTFFRSAYVDRLESPSAWKGHPDEVPAQCACRFWTLSIEQILAALDRGGRVLLSRDGALC